MSETVLKDCADEIPYLQVKTWIQYFFSIFKYFFKTLSEENFSLQNYLREKNRLPTPPPPPDVVDEVQQSEEQQEDAQVIDEEEEQIAAADEEKSDMNIDESTSQPDVAVTDRITDEPVRSQSPGHEEPTSTEMDAVSQPIPKQPNVTPNLYSPATSATPIAPAIRVEISEKSKSFIPLTRQPTQPHKELLPVPPPPPPPSSQPHRGRRQPTEPFRRTSVKIGPFEQPSGRRYGQ